MGDNDLNACLKSEAVLFPHISDFRPTRMYFIVMSQNKIYYEDYIVLMSDSEIKLIKLLDKRVV